MLMKIASFDFILATSPQRIKTSALFFTMLLYFDTNVILDALLERKNKYGRDISLPASKLLFQIVECKHYIVISNWAKRELGKHIKNVNSLFALIKPKMHTVNYTEEDVEEAKRRSPEHYEDALHGILAHKAGADFIVTRNVTDFRCVSDLIEARRPEFFL